MLDTAAKKDRWWRGDGVGNGIRTKVGIDSRSWGEVMVLSAPLAGSSKRFLLSSR